MERKCALFHVCEAVSATDVRKDWLRNGEPSEMKRENRPPNAELGERGESRFCREPGFAREASSAVGDANLGTRRQERGIGLSTIRELWK